MTKIIVSKERMYDIIRAPRDHRKGDDGIRA